MLALCLGVLAWAFPAGAQSRRDDNDKKQATSEMREEARKVFDRDERRSTENAADGKHWVIAIASIRGTPSEREEAGRIMLRETQTTGQLPEAYIDRRTNADVIAVGRFDSPDDSEAQQELARIRSILVNGVTPYYFAFLSPPENSLDLGSRPEYNLLQAKLLHGDRAIQTLQVAVYGRDDLKEPKEADLKEVRKKAEEAATILRQEGDLAFYYHGPRRSMVTVGIFDLTDYDPQTPNLNSPRLREAKRKYPFNLYNGAKIREKRPGEKDRFQPSTLVAIPSPPAAPPTNQPAAPTPAPARDMVPR